MENERGDKGLSELYEGDRDTERIEKKRFSKTSGQRRCRGDLNCKMRERTRERDWEYWTDGVEWGIVNS